MDGRWVVSDLTTMVGTQAPAEAQTAATAAAASVTADVTAVEVPDAGVVQVVTVPLGAASLVLGVTADGGVLGCGAIDPGPLGRLGIAAARVRPTTGPSIGCAADLLAGVVTEANALAQARGVVVGVPGEVALVRL